MTTLTLHSESDLDQLVDTYIEYAKETKLAFLIGDLGAGKTTFVKRLSTLLGSQDLASSPTYSIVNEYELSDGKLYHIDLYRLNDEKEALDIGIEEYIFSNEYCLIEWPQIIQNLVDQAVVIFIEADEEGKRHIKIDFLKNGCL